MNADRKAHAFAVRALRKLGRDLMAEYSLSPEQALRVIGRAAVTTVRLGVASAVNALDQALDDVLRG